MEKKNGVVVITDLRSNEAKDAFEYLTQEGYTVINPENVCLYNEEELTAYANGINEEIIGVIHPAPPRILGGINDVTEEQWITARDEGAIAAWCVSKVFGGKMREQGKGAMIYLNSIHAEKPIGKGFLFSINCGAVQMLSREFSQDYTPEGVNCYFVEKGITEDELDSKSDVSDLYYGVDLKYPRRKMPERGHLNSLLAFLLTPEAWPLSGSDLRADNGLIMFYGHRKKVEGRPYFEWGGKKANEPDKK